MANTNFDHPIYKAIAQLIEGGEAMELTIHAVSCDCEMGEATAEELYKAGCDPITAQYLATGELPG